MREPWARRLAILTGVLVLGLSALIATRFEASADAPAAAATRPVPAADLEQVARGAEVFAREGCAGCHSIAGDGNPRNPLDGVGARLGADELLHWTVGAPEVADRMSRRTAMMKQGYADLGETDLDALVAFLATLR
ncbi:MAG TPA: cytochrome c [Xanthomonadaceae bacterium]|nr:cytochrome c [Xanthomonadaceae bacterium]